MYNALCEHKSMEGNYCYYTYGIILYLCLIDSNHVTGVVNTGFLVPILSVVPKYFSL